MEIKVQINEEEVKLYVIRSMMADYERDRGMLHTLITRAAKEAVREIIYKDREEIERRIVNQAASSCSGKAAKKLAEMMIDD